MGLFHRGLKELGVNLQADTARGEEPFTGSEGAEHFQKISGKPNVVLPEVLARLPRRRPVAARLAEVPSAREVLQRMKEMKDSAGGKDEMRKLLVFAAGELDGR